MVLSFRGVVCSNFALPNITAGDIRKFPAEFKTVKRICVRGVFLVLSKLKGVG